MAVGRRDGRTGHDVLRRVGEASVLVLISLADGPKHGYALIQDIKELAGVELGPGTLYGALDRLERLGLIESLRADDRRHPHRITAARAAAPPGPPWRAGSGRAGPGACACNWVASDGRPSGSPPGRNGAALLSGPLAT